VPTHLALGSRAGLQDEELSWLSEWPDAPCFDATDRLVLRYADSLTRDVRRDEWWRGIPHRLFTASVIIVALHVAIETAGHLADKLHLVRTGIESLPWVEVLLASAIALAALPVNSVVLSKAA